jgi:hypothetical protein
VLTVVLLFLPRDGFQLFVLLGTLALASWLCFAIAIFLKTTALYNRTDNSLIVARGAFGLGPRGSLIRGNIRLRRARVNLVHRAFTWSGHGLVLCAGTTPVFIPVLDKSPDMVDRYLRDLPEDLRALLDGSLSLNLIGRHS